MSINQPKVFIEICDEEQEMWNGELNSLRESGDMNMFGAVRWLLDNFDMSENGAKQIFYNWTRTFEEENSPASTGGMEELKKLLRF